MAKQKRLYPLQSDVVGYTAAIKKVAFASAHSKVSLFLMPYGFLPKQWQTDTELQASISHALDDAKKTLGDNAITLFKKSCQRDIHYYKRHLDIATLQTMDDTIPDVSWINANIRTTIYTSIAESALLSHTDNISKAMDDLIQALLPNDNTEKASAPSQAEADTEIPIADYDPQEDDGIRSMYLSETYKQSLRRSLEDFIWSDASRVSQFVKALPKYFPGEELDRRTAARLLKTPQQKEEFLKLLEKDIEHYRYLFGKKHYDVFMQAQFPNQMAFTEEDMQDYLECKERYSWMTPAIQQLCESYIYGHLVLPSRYEDAISMWAARTLLPTLGIHLEAQEHKKHSPEKLRAEGNEHLFMQRLYDMQGAIVKAAMIFPGRLTKKNPITEETLSGVVADTIHTRTKEILQAMDPADREHEAKIAARNAQALSSGQQHLPISRSNTADEKLPEKPSRKLVPTRRSMALTVSFGEKEEWAETLTELTKDNEDIAEETQREKIECHTVTFELDKNSRWVAAILPKGEEPRTWAKILGKKLASEDFSYLPEGRAFAVEERAFTNLIAAEKARKAVKAVPRLVLPTASATATVDDPTSTSDGTSSPSSSSSIPLSSRSNSSDSGSSRSNNSSDSTPLVDGSILYYL